MNEALSGEISQIIADEPSSSSSSEMSSVLEQPTAGGTATSAAGNSAFTSGGAAEELVPYLMVHSIVSASSAAGKSAKTEWKRDKNRCQVSPMPSAARLFGTFASRFLHQKRTLAAELLRRQVCGR